MRKGARSFICGGEEFGTAADVRLQRYDCPNAANHAPMPEAYLAWHAVAERRERAGQKSYRCPDCGLFALVTGGASVPGWPMRSHGLLPTQASDSWEKAT